MKLHILLLTAAFLLLAWTVPAGAQSIPGPKGLNTGATAGSVTISASNAAAQVVASMSYGFLFTIPANAASAIWMFPLDAGSPCSGVTSATGARLTAGSAYWCSPYDATSFCFNWFGQICGIRDTGSGAITIPLVGR